MNFPLIAVKDFTTAGYKTQLTSSLMPTFPFS